MGQSGSPVVISKPTKAKNRTLSLVREKHAILKELPEEFVSPDLKNAFLLTGDPEQLTAGRKKFTRQSIPFEISGGWFRWNRPVGMH